MKFNIFFLLLLLFNYFSLTLKSQDQVNTDSLLKVYYYQNDTNQLNTAWLIFDKNQLIDPDTCLNLCKAVIAKTQSDLFLKKYEAKAYHTIGIIKNRQGEYDEALENYQKALNIRKTLKSEEKELSKTLNNIGSTYLNLAKYDQAVKSYLEAAKIKDRIGDKKGAVNSIIGVGNVYFLSQNYKKAEEYWNNALKQANNANYEEGQASCYNSIGLINTEKGNLIEKEKDFVKSHKKQKEANINWEKAIEYYKKAALINEKTNNKVSLPDCYNNIGANYTRLKQYKLAYEYYNKALELRKELGEKQGIASALFNIGINFRYSKNYKEALTYIEKSYQIAKEINHKKTISEIFKEYSVVYDSTKNYMLALKYYRNYSDLKDSIFNEESSKQMSELSTKYETEKKEQEIILLSKEKEVQNAKLARQQAYILFSVIAFVLVLLLVFFIYSRYRMKNKANKELAAKNALITQQKLEITDSIHYAKRIQTAILPHGDYISELMPFRFILFKPRDIVSGDFYWMKQIKHANIIIATAADCTGHGVPGAFMSMLGVAFLNEIVNKPDVIHASQVLEQLREKVIASLHQTGRSGEAQDGMDIALCAINTETKICEYAGANNPLYLIRNNELTEIKADKMPIGIHIRSGEPFTNNVIQLQTGDCIYLFSDGYIDQFGGEHGKKFMSKNFKNFLLEIHQYPMSEQRQMLDDKLINWMGEIEQIDDILVMGIQIP